MQPLAIAAALAAGYLSVADGVPHHVLDRNEEQDSLITFDHTVLGNLKNREELEGLRVVHKHIFSAKITVGTPPQTMSCLLDSGSADLLLPSKRCVSCPGAHHFHADQSSTFMPATIRLPDGLMPVPVQISHGARDIVGYLVQDHVAIAKRTFLNQSFIIVEEEELPEDRSWDGVCGLGWRQLTDAGLPMYRNIHEDEEPIFSLIPKGFGKDATTFLTVGGLPEDSLNMKSLAWAPVEPLLHGGKRSYWVARGQVNVNLDARFLVDTASAYIMAPRAVYKQVLSSLLPDNIFQESCGVDKDAGNLVVCSCEATMENRAIWDRKLTVHLGQGNYLIRVPHLFKQVEASHAKMRLCLLLVQPAPLASMALDPLEAAQESFGGEAAKAKSKDGPSLLSFLFPSLAPAGALGGGKGAKNEKPEEDGRRLQMHDPMENMWILGGVFLERFSVVFDFQHQRLGIAVANDQESAEMLEARAIAASERAGLQWLTIMFIMVLVGGSGYYAGNSYLFRRKNLRTLRSVGPDALAPSE